MEHLSVLSNEEVRNVQGKGDNKCSWNRLLFLFHEMRKNILLMSMILMAEPPLYLSVMRSMRTRKFLLPHTSSCYHTEVPVTTRKFLLPHGSSCCHGSRVCVFPTHRNVWINRHLAENLRQPRIFLAAIWIRKGLTIPFFWDIMLCQYLIGSWLFEQSWPHHLQGSRPRYLETPKTCYTVT